MDKKNNFNSKYFQSRNKKKYDAVHSVNNYLGQLKLHFELSDIEMCDIIKIIANDYKKQYHLKGGGKYWVNIIKSLCRIWWRNERR